MEHVACLSSAVDAYNGLHGIARDRGLPHHAIQVGLVDLAKVMGYVGPQGTPDASNALKAIRVAEAANILVTLAKGAPCGKDVPAHLRRSNIYCLRASFETLEAAVADGKEQWPYLERMKLEAPVTEPVDEPVFVSDLPPATSCSPQATLGGITPAAEVQTDVIDLLDFLVEVDRILVAEVSPCELSAARQYWTNDKLRDVLRQHPKTAVWALRRELQERAQPRLVPF